MRARRTTLIALTVTVAMTVALFVAASDAGGETPAKRVPPRTAPAVTTTTTTTVVPAPECSPECAAWVTATLTQQWYEHAAHADPFLVCTRAHESSHTPPLHDDGYQAVNPSGSYRGAYQFARSTWDNTARHRGWPHLVGVDPARATVAQQDFLALDLYRWQGASPWLGRCD